MFKEDIARSIGKVLVNNKHKKLVLTRDYVMFVKRYSEELAFYIKCCDKRKWDQGISVEIIFTTIGIPDDSLFASGVGIHVQILTVIDEVTDDIMIRAGEKIITVENSLIGFADFVLEELDNAYFQTRRLHIYKRGLFIYKIIKEDENMREEFALLKKDICGLIKSRKTKQAYQRSIDFMEQLPDDYFKDRKTDLGTDLDTATFAEYIYAQCILDV